MFSGLFSTPDRTNGEWVLMINCTLGNVLRIRARTDCSNSGCKWRSISSITTIPARSVVLPLLRSNERYAISSTIKNRRL